ncbi:outer membrane beta-barrel protein [Maribellus maritimus]|uniref:outer membrane beta-barrel protein n=1 Tax=Maribellus maritimus TaxID=2870838 RepID=UPI001EECA20D|nr:outer membrane beta-barrel protein [Maribellus maritimus]MCG6188160.1 porin family protein [Maribellus maritimus]
MRKIVLFFLLIILSIGGNSQNKQNSISIGVNRMQPTNTGSNYEADVGFQINLFSRKVISKSFSFEKGVSIIYTRFDDHKEHELLLENNTYSLSVPLKYYWTRINYAHPFLGIEGIWRFYSDTDYFALNIQKNEVSKLQLAFILGTEVRILKQFDISLKYLLTPYLISYGTMDLNGFQVSLIYTFNY